jgi:hypothetical protein
MEFRIREEASPDATATSAAPAVGGADPRTEEPARELDHRCNDRVDVWLRWRKSDDLVFVEVADGRTGERFLIEVADGERPLEVFRHPYAYPRNRRTDVPAEVES